MFVCVLSRVGDVSASSGYFRARARARLESRRGRAEESVVVFVVRSSLQRGNASKRDGERPEPQRRATGR